MTALTIDIPRALWFTSNDLRGSHYKWSPKIKALRALGKRSVPPRSHRHNIVTLTITVGYPTATRADLALLIASASQLSDSYRLTYGDDMATVSGTRRKHSDTATARKFGANTREAAAWAAVRHAGVDVERIERRITLAVRDTPIPYTPADLAGARLVRDRYGWHNVVRVNVKSVTVSSEWSWNDRIDLADVIEVRA